VCALGAAEPGAARTLTVPADHATIQAAVQAAGAGDTVLVGPGRYRELIRMKAGVVLRSAAGPDSTILEMPGLAETPLDERLLECVAGVDRSTVIEGFALESLGIRGAAIWCENASPTIRGNVIHDFGWGIYLRNRSNALVENNVVKGCRSFGVMIFASSPELRGNTITDNEPTGITIGGRRSRPVIGGRAEHANRIYDNTYAVVNESRNDIDATWNDWGWVSMIEMERGDYPTDVTAIRDGNDRSSSAGGKGKVDYRNWVRPPDPDPRAASAARPDSAAAVATPAGPPSSARPAARGLRWIIPAAIAAGLIALFAIVSRRGS
jgi:parallel beta-helix repeat protein